MKQQPIINESWVNATSMLCGISYAGMVLAGVAGAGTGAVMAGSDSRRRDILTRAFADEVIPLLLDRRRAAAPRKAAMAETGACIERLLALVLTGTQAEAADYVTALHDTGAPVASILLDVLAPVARRLGQMWEDDTCTFSDVTLGLGRLGHLMRELGDDCGETALLQASPTALLVQMPGEQHGFGLAMVVHFFRQGGWRVRQAPLVTSAELVGIVRKDWFGIVGISVACSDRIEALAGDIRAIRKHSRNRDVGVMVGGPPFLAHPQLAELVGADATATDGQQALLEAHRLVGLRARAQ